MKHGAKLYWTLFSSTFTLSTFTFGGGYVIVPLMKKRFVDQLHWLEEQEMLDLTALAQSAPGAIAVNTSILLGYRVAGILGAAVSILGTVLPPLLILSVISLFYTAFRTNRVVGALLRGMRSGVAAVVCSVVVDMAWPVLRGKEVLPSLILVGAFLITLLLPDLNVIWIILSCAALGVAATLIRKHREVAP